jgi:hypothetical protein
MNRHERRKAASMAKSQQTVAAVDTEADLRQKIFQAIGFLNDDEHDIVISVQAMRPIVEALMKSLVIVVSCLPKDLRAAYVGDIANNIEKWVEAEAEDIPVETVLTQ